MDQPAEQRPFVIVIGGAPPHPRVPRPHGATVIAADSGLDHARALGWDVDLVVGDLDSVSADAIDAATRAGTPIERYPVEKDAIDTELAIDAALKRGATSIELVSGGGDRLDQLLAGLLLLADPRLAHVPTSAWCGTARVHALQGPAAVTVEGPAGALVSLVPVGGPVHGARTDGLRYPLNGEPLAAGTTRGISNELLGGPAHVALERGALLVIVPYALGGDT